MASDGFHTVNWIVLCESFMKVCSVNWIPSENAIMSTVGL